MRHRLAVHRQAPADAMAARKPRRARRAQASARGFTLIELTVALMAGLFVAMGIVALSREATRTFHEEVRSSAAEATLRTAVDRLRADLQRAGYMSTGNLSGDPMIAVAPGANNWANINPSVMKGLRRLASVHLIEGGSVLQNTLALSGSQVPAVKPDILEIGGNLSSAEQFEVELIEPAGGAAPAGCQRILLSPTSPALYRIAPTSDTAPGQELRNAFQPVPTGLKTQFIARLVDDTGHEQFLATCPEASAAGYDSSGEPYVDIDATNTPVQTAQQTQTQGGISGYASGRATVNPVQIVRWEITSATLEQTNQPQYAQALGNQSTAYGTVDPNKYDLMRTYVDALGNPIWKSSEVVAEYAVDLDFAFSVDQGTPTAPQIVTYAFEDNADNDAWAPDVSTQLAPPWTPGPQRIREVRARVVTRTQMGDRTVNVPVANFGAEQYLYRYCVLPPCTTYDGSLRWARARTLTIEVSLPNDAGNFF